MNHSPTSTAENRPAMLEQAESTRSSWWASAIALPLAAGLLLPASRTIWQGAGGRWAYILIVSGLIAFGLTPLVIRLAHAFDVLDVPAFRKVHSEPTPLLGGLAIYAAFTTAILANSILDRQVSAILIGGSLLVFVGILDDIFDVPAIVRLVAQLVAAAIVIGSGVAITLFPRFRFGDFIDTILTIVWLLGITNAMNFFDGMDGLATGLSIVTASFLGLSRSSTFSLFGVVPRRSRGKLPGLSPLQFQAKRSGTRLPGRRRQHLPWLRSGRPGGKGRMGREQHHRYRRTGPDLLGLHLRHDVHHCGARPHGQGARLRRLDRLCRERSPPPPARFPSGEQRKAVFLVFLFAVCTGLAAIALVHASTMEAAILILQAIVIVVIFSILEHAGNR